VSAPGQNSPLRRAGGASGLPLTADGLVQRRERWKSDRTRRDEEEPQERNSHGGTTESSRPRNGSRDGAERPKGCLVRAAPNVGYCTTAATSVRARNRRSGKMFHELCPAMDLRWAARVASLRLFALPDRDRQKLVGGTIVKQVASDETFAPEGTDVLWPFGNGCLSCARLGLEVITRAYIDSSMVQLLRLPE